MILLPPPGRGLSRAWTEEIGRLGEAAQLKAFTGAIVLVGCGSFGQPVLPLLVRDLGIEPAPLTVVTADQRGHALAERLGVRFILTALTTRAPRAADEFVSTWSIEGFLTEGTQPAELGGGTAKAALPTDGRRLTADGPWVYLLRPGVDVRVRSWAPAADPFVGYLITHMESLSIADHLTLREHWRIAYRPTVYYAYCPCPDTILSLHDLLARSFAPPPRSRILAEEIVSGQDELGVLLAGHPGRLLVRLATRHRGGAGHCAARQCHRAAGGCRDLGRLGGGLRAAKAWPGGA